MFAHSLLNLPAHSPAAACVKHIATKHRHTGYVRISYGNQPPERMPMAAARLKAGLARLVAEGIDG